MPNNRANIIKGRTNKLFVIINNTPFCSSFYKSRIINTINCIINSS